VRVDGCAEAVVETADDDTSAAGYACYIGAHPQGRTIVQQLQGDIAELIVTRGPSETYVTRLESSLRSKYGLAW